MKKVKNNKNKETLFNQSRNFFFEISRLSWIGENKMQLKSKYL
jgi:hypothetical protein